jgi:hypothetical protein
MTSVATRATLLTGTESWGRLARFTHMHRFPALLFAASLAMVAGCPSVKKQYLVAEVTASAAPLSDALVAAECGRSSGTALRTAADGRATLPLFGEPDLKACEVTVAKPGYRTVRRGEARICEAAECAPNRYELEPEAGR